MYTYISSFVATIALLLNSYVIMRLHNCIKDQQKQIEEISTQLTELAEPLAVNNNGQINNESFEHIKTIRADNLEVNRIVSKEAEIATVMAVEANCESVNANIVETKNFEQHIRRYPAETSSTSSQDSSDRNMRVKIYASPPESIYNERPRGGSLVRQPKNTPLSSSKSKTSSQESLLDTQPKRKNLLNLSKIR